MIANQLRRWPGIILGLDNAPGRRAWLWGLMVLLLAAGLAVYWCQVRPWWGGRLVRAYVLEHLEPGGRGLLGLYYPNLDMAGKPHVLEPKPLLLLPDGKKHYYTLRWLGAVYAPRSGRFGFGGQADDGLMVLIDGKPVARDWHQAPSREVWGKVRLSQGWHAIEVRYFQAGGEAVHVVKWQPPGGNRAPLAKARLRPLSPKADPAHITRLRLAHGLTPILGSTYPPLTGGRHWELPW